MERRAFAQAYLNSAYIAVLVVIGTLITASMAGYAFARIRFRGSRVLFIVFLATQMIPKQVTLIPFYLLMTQLGWVDSHLALIVPRHDRQPLRGVPDAPVRAVAAQGARGGGAGGRRGGGSARSSR